MLVMLALTLMSGCYSSSDLDGDGYVNCALAVNDWPNERNPMGCKNLDPSPDDDSDLYGPFNGAVHDCDDANPDIHPDAVEVCNGLDDNCDGVWDEGSNGDPDSDCDQDGYLAPEDCDPLDAAIHPDAEELLDQRDNNCDGLCLAEECSDDPDTECPCSPEVLITSTPGDPGCTCAIGSSPSTLYLALTVALVAGWRRRRVNTASAYGLVLLSCSQATSYPSPQLMIDPNDADGDGVAQSDDCDDRNSSIHPNAEDRPGDGIDQDCSGVDATATTGDTGHSETDTDADTDSDTDADTDADTDSDTDADTDTTAETGHTGMVVHTAHTGVPVPTCSSVPGIGEACVCLKAAPPVIGDVTWYVRTLGIGEATYWRWGAMSFAVAPVEDWGCNVLAYSNGGMLIDASWVDNLSANRLLFEDTANLGRFGYTGHLTEVWVDGVLQDLSGCFSTSADVLVNHNYVECPSW